MGSGPVTVPLAAVTTELPAIVNAAANTSALALLPDWLDPEHIIQSLGPFALIGVCLIIFAECGLLIGFFLPGDSLLFVTGLFVATGAINTPFWLVCVLLAVCAFVGNATGYWIGRKVGPSMFNKPNSKLFKREHVDKTHEFFERYGGKTIVLARFVPIVRTYAPFVAGASAITRRWAVSRSPGRRRNRSSREDSRAMPSLYRRGRRCRARNFSVALFLEPF